MFKNIVENIICSEFQRTFGRDSRAANDQNRMSDAENAMQIKFSLSPDYGKEDGYRNLTLLIFGGGSNYISVFARLDWNVISIDGIDEEYTSGETDWVLLGCHDSCWRDAVGSLLWKYRDRISTIDYLFNGPTGWFRSLPISSETAARLDSIRRQTPGYGNERGERIELKDLEFKFPDNGNQPPTATAE